MAKAASKTTTDTPEPTGSAKTQFKAEPKAPPAPKVVWYESRDKEPYGFDVCGIRPIRNFSNGRLEWEVPEDQVERFEQNHFFRSSRVVAKAIQKDAK